MPNMHIKSSEYAWHHTEVKIADRIIVGITAWELKKTVEKEEQYGAGQHPIDIQAGNIKCSGSITLWGYEADRLEQAAQAAGYTLQPKVCDDERRNGGDLNAQARFIVASPFRRSTRRGFHRDHRHPQAERQKTRVLYAVHLYGHQQNNHQSLTVMNQTTQQPAPAAVQLAEQRFGKDKLDLLAKEFNGRKLCIIAVEDKIAILKPLNAKELSDYTRTMMSAGLDVAARQLLDALWLGGDECIRDDEDYISLANRSRYGNTIGTLYQRQKQTTTKKYQSINPFNHA